ncbi:MAG TPA: anaerobic ribonucleoside-triphosphate reductase [Spirochaetota bacterium]|nr:anaerobic ribonucleoside-triphosphate reductase [Spirochaetota bacterium]HNT13117.1 anaerobic ribonucleoside-triphosphate reductase [Spirochaetota bacterium]
MSDNSKKIPVEVYSRVVGYFRPVNQWNKGKREEFQNRVHYKIDYANLRFNNTNNHGD